MSRFSWEAEPRDAGKTPIESIRIVPSNYPPENADQIYSFHTRQFSGDVRQRPTVNCARFGENEVSILPLGSGLEREIGVVIAGSQEIDFPRQTERWRSGPITGYTYLSPKCCRKGVMSYCRPPKSCNVDKLGMFDNSWKAGLRDTLPSRIFCPKNCPKKI